MKPSARAVSVLFWVAAISAAQTTPPAAPDPLELPPVKKPSAAPQSSDSTAKPYIIGPLDVLYIRVWNQPNLTGPVNVGPDGMLSISLVGEIAADGLTVEQLRGAIKTRLDRDFFNSSEVSVEVVKINSKKFFIMGGVNRPGPYPLNGKTTVSEALSNASGFSGFANQKKIYVLRGAKKIPFNYKDVIAGKHLEQDIELENGDKIVVPE
jgi:polysaccharide export outer membrane protein